MIKTYRNKTSELIKKCYNNNNNNNKSHVLEKKNNNPLIFKAATS